MNGFLVALLSSGLNMLEEVSYSIKVSHKHSPQRLSVCVSVHECGHVCQRVFLCIKYLSLCICTYTYTGMYTCFYLYVTVCLLYLCLCSGLCVCRVVT